MRTLGWSLVVLTIVVVAGAALMWPRDDTPRDPDAIFVLGGVGMDRTRLGIELRDRYDAVLVLSSSAAHFGTQAGLTCGVDAWCVMPEPETTAGEARMAARMADEMGWEHVTVATSRHHTTRTRVLFRQCLGDRVSVVGSERPARSRGAAVRRALHETAGTVAALTIRRAC